MDNLDDHHYTVLRVCLSFVGLWPYDQTWFAYTKRMIFILLISSAFVFQFQALFFGEKLTSNIIVDGLMNINLTFGMVVKYLLFLWRLKYMKQLLEAIRKHWRDINDEYETKILLKKADNCKLLTITVMGTMDIVVMIFIVYMTTLRIDSTSSTTAKKDYIVNSRLKFLCTKNGEKFSLISLLYIYVTAIMGLCVFTGTEAMTFMFCFHSYAIFEVLSHRIVNAFNDDETNVVALKKGKRNLQRLVAVGILHEHLLRQRNVFKKAISWSHFILICLTVITQSIILLRLVYIFQRTRSLLRILPTLSLAVALFTYVALANNLGQMGNDSSTNFFIDTYNSVWYKGSVAEQKMLLFIMLHTMKHYTFLIGGLYRPCREGFAMITKLSMSYLTVMYSIEI